MQFQSRIVSPKSKIKDLLVIFQKHPSKFIYVVDNRNILLGLISEGDLRRFLINSDTFDYTASEVMIKKFIFIRY